MKKLIINADDFGLTNAISDAIIEVFKAGNLSSTTLMVNMPGTDYAIQLARKNPNLGIGLHFNITEGITMAGVSSLTNKKGDFSDRMSVNKKVQFGNKKTLKDIQKELSIQYEALENSGIKITHIDSHQHIHMNPIIFPLIADFAKAKNVNIRIAFPQILKRTSGKINIIKRAKQTMLKYAANKNARYADKIGLKYNKSFNSIFDFHPFQNPNEDDYHQLITAANSDFHELMIHPYILSDDLKQIYPKNYDNKLAFFEKAAKEYEILSELNLNNALLFNFKQEPIR